MNKIRNAFQNKKAFVGFLTAGDPSLEKTRDYIWAMEEAGADLIEIGIPFSDPIAEGKVIERANLRALSVGTTTDGVFEMVREVRTKSSIPLVFLTYLNPVFRYGYEKFFAKCKSVGIDGIIIPDLPFEEKEEVVSVANQFDVDLISLIAPTSKDRITMIARESKGFLYVVSSMGVTGVRNEIRTDLETMVTVAKEVTDTPICVGFGISTKKQASEIGMYADGVIVGSAIVKIIEEFGENAKENLYQYVKEMKNNLN